MLETFCADYPNVKYVGTQVRGALSADMINWSAILYEVATKKIYKAAVRENVEIMDRVGGGDSFMAGVAAAFLQVKSAPPTPSRPAALPAGSRVATHATRPASPPFTHTFLSTAVLHCRARARRRPWSGAPRTASWCRRPPETPP
jgi:2-dehydro-3-deoxygluconokinase